MLIQALAMLRTPQPDPQHTLEAGHRDYIPPSGTLEEINDRLRAEVGFPRHRPDGPALETGTESLRNAGREQGLRWGGLYESALRPFTRRQVGD